MIMVKSIQSNTKSSASFIDNNFLPSERFCESFREIPMLPVALTLPPLKSRERECSMITSLMGERALRPGYMTRAHVYSIFCSMVFLSEPSRSGGERTGVINHILFEIFPVNCVGFLKKPLGKCPIPGLTLTSGWLTRIPPPDGYVSPSSDRGMCGEVVLSPPVLFRHKVFHTRDRKSSRKIRPVFLIRTGLQQRQLRI
jgi:hypothetical protein